MGARGSASADRRTRRLELEGYRPLERTLWVFQADNIVDATIDGPNALYNPIKLDTEESLPAGKVRVPGWEQNVDGQALRFEDFFLGRHEVTNREFKAFVNGGGYETPRYWQHPFVRDGTELPFEEAMRLFTDQSGRPGPSTWLGGDYPDGQDDYPVNGVTWYEAAAYAAFVGEELPTVHHWRRAINEWHSGWVLPASNMQAEGPRPVGEAPGMSWSGASWAATCGSGSTTG